MHWFHKLLSWFLLIFVGSAMIALLGTFNFLPNEFEPNQLLAAKIVAGVSLILTLAGAISD